MVFNMNTFMAVVLISIMFLQLINRIMYYIIWSGAYFGHKALTYALIYDLAAVIDDFGWQEPQVA